MPPRKKLDLVGTWEIKEEYGIPRHRVARFMQRGQWPQPIADIHAGGVWHRDDVERAIAKLRSRSLL